MQRKDIALNPLHWGMGFLIYSVMGNKVEYILQHCFIGDAKQYAKRNLQGKLLDSIAKNDLELADQMNSDCVERNVIKEDAFNRLYTFGNMHNKRISDFILSEIPEKEWESRIEPHQEGGYHTGRYYYLGDESIDMGYPEYGNSELFYHVADEMCYWYGYEKGKKKMEEVGIKPKPFGNSKADYITGTMFAIQELFEEIKDELI